MGSLGPHLLDDLAARMLGVFVGAGQEGGLEGKDHPIVNDNDGGCRTAPLKERTGSMSVPASPSWAFSPESQGT